MHHNSRSSVYPSLHTRYVRVSPETIREREEIDHAFATQQKTAFDVTSVKRAEELFDNAFDSHPIRQSALVRRKKDKITFDKFDFEERHLRFIISTLVDHEMLQQKHLGCGMEENQKGLPLHLLNFLLEKHFEVKNSPQKLLKFISMREYQRNFRVFTYSIPHRPKLYFISLLSTHVGRFTPLPSKMELEESHVPLIRSLIEISDHLWIKLSTLKKKLMEEHDVRAVQLKEFLDKYPSDFIIGQNRKALSVRLATIEEVEKQSLDISITSDQLDLEEQVQVSDLPDFELPENFDIVVSHDERVIQKWIFDNVQLPLVTQENIVIGIDSEWSIIHLHPLVIVNPHLFHLVKRKYGLREHDQGQFPDLIQISTNKSCLLLQTLGGAVHPPEELVQIFADPRVLKVFCNYSSDLLRLKQWFLHFGIETRMPSLIDIDENSQGCSKLCVEKLKQNYTKQRGLQLSRWSKRELSADQISYAAKDAYLNVLFYEKDPSMAKYVSDVIKEKKKKEPQVTTSETKEE